MFEATIIAYHAYNGRMTKTTNTIELNSCEGYLKSLQEMGILVGDFYLLLGRSWKAAGHRPPKYRPGAKKQCYRNAFNLAQDYGLTYCEGFAYPPGLIPVHHAWCVDDSGHVIDPTWDNADSEYFGIALRLDYVLSYLEKHQIWGLLGECLPRDILDAPLDQLLEERWRNPVESLAQWTELLAAKTGRRQVAHKSFPTLSA
jgi:hypothetical protein